MTLFKQITRHRMAFCEIKTTCSSDFLKKVMFIYDFENGEKKIE
jgi:hypothetical protein